MQLQCVLTNVGFVVVVSTPAEAAMNTNFAKFGLAGLNPHPEQASRAPGQTNPSTTFASSSTNSKLDGASRQTRGLMTSTDDFGSSSPRMSRDKVFPKEGRNMSPRSRSDANTSSHGPGPELSGLKRSMNIDALRNIVQMSGLSGVQESGRRKSTAEEIFQASSTPSMQPTNASQIPLFDDKINPWKSVHDSKSRTVVGNGRDKHGVTEDANIAGHVSIDGHIVGRQQSKSIPNITSSIKQSSTTEESKHNHKVKTKVHIICFSNCT